MSAMELLDIILGYKKKSLHWLGKQCNESKSQIYNRKVAEDIKVEVFKKYLKELGCHIEIVDDYSPTRWVL